MDGQYGSSAQIDPMARPARPLRNAVRRVLYRHRMRAHFTSDPAEVSARMRLIRGKDTKPELALFNVLTEAGIEFQAHQRVAGVSVDAVVQGTVLVFVDSPFWHLRDVRELDRLSPYWQARLLRNRKRDRRQVRHLRTQGYTVIRFWADQIEPGYVTRRVRSGCTRAARRNATNGRVDLA